MKNNIQCLKEITKYIVIWSVSLLTLNQLQAQNKTASYKITGKVVSAGSHKALTGVVIHLQQAGTSTITDKKGKFSLPVKSNTDTLIAHYVGYQDQYIPVSSKNKSPLSIYLQKDTIALNEITVSTGYQQLPKARSTGSFEKVSNEMLNLRPTTDILSRLEGVSSILFDKNDNRPPLTIRGLSTINGNKSPLIILDNFPYHGNISNINPNDVESITILKDAAAASIWGTRAGNGVIVITTKKGQFNQPLKVSISSHLSVAQKPDLFYLKRMTTKDFIDVEQFLFSKGYYNNLENNTYSRPPLSPVVEHLIAERDGRMGHDEVTAFIEKMKDRDIRSAFSADFYQPAVQQQYALNIQGGSDKATYFLSGGFDKNVTNLNARMNRLTFRSENTLKLTNAFMLHAGVAYAKTNNSSGKEVFSNFKSTYPYAKFKNKEGNPLPLARYRQSYIDTAGGGRLLDWNYYPLTDYTHNKRKVATEDLIARLGLDYEINSVLNVNLKYQYERQSVDQRRLYDLSSFYARDLINKFSVINWNTGTVTYHVPKGGILNWDNQTMTGQSARAQLNFSKTWRKNTVTALAGGELREIKTHGKSGRDYGYDKDLLLSSKVDYLNSYPNYINKRNNFIPNFDGEDQTLNHFVSMFANASYNYDNRYTISASARRDASNLFGVNTNDKWKPLWSVGGAWSLSNEDFYHLSWLPFLKLRTSYGYTGNVVQNDIAAVTTLLFSSGARFTNFRHASISNFGNPDLRWEEVRITNVGLDFETKNNRLSGSIEYYTKKGTDLLGNAPIDYTAGAGIDGTIMKNVASMIGKGINIKLHSVLIDRKLKWSSSLLFNYHQDKVLKYYLPNNYGSFYLADGNVISPLEGKSIYSIVTYKWAGLDNSGNPQGILEGKPTTDYFGIYAQTTVDDLVYNGPALPKIYGNFNNTISWNHFDFTACISFQFGNYFKRKSINYESLFAQHRGHSDFSKRWQKTGDEKYTTVPAMIYPNNRYRDRFYRNAEVLVDKGGNIHLEYVNLSYDFNSLFNSPGHIPRLKCYINVGNIGLLWKANKHNLDPEYLPPSIPPGTRFTVGIRASF